MTVGTIQETVPDARPRRRALGPLVMVRVVQVVLWLLVISGPVAALFVATQLSAIGDRLDTLAATTAPGCSVPTFHGSAADVAGVAGSLVTLLGQQIRSNTSGIHLVALPHAGNDGPHHHYIPAPSTK